MPFKIIYKNIWLGIWLKKKELESISLLLTFKIFSRRLL